MAAYWPIKFSFCVFMNGDGVEVHKLYFLAGQGG